MIRKTTTLFLLLSYVSYCKAQENDQLHLMKASDHPMQYYISLPEGWKTDREWPVVVIAEAAEKDFKVNMQRFIEARVNMPFILVAPIIVTNGNYGMHDPHVYPYDKATWDLIDKEGICSFDMQGLQEVLKDVQQHYRGTRKYYITGFEAGTHLVWAMVFQHPDQLYAAAPVAGNYISRCMNALSFSTDRSVTVLPVRGFYGSADTLCAPGGPLYKQWLEAKKLAKQHGYQHIEEIAISGKGHIPLPREVLEWFNKIQQGL